MKKNFRTKHRSLINLNIINKLRIYLILLINFIDNRVFGEDYTSKSIYGLTRSTLELFSRHIDKIGYLLIPIFALALRLNNYTIIPVHNATADEYAFAWAGWSLLHGKKPVAWTGLPVYPEGQLIIWRGNRYRIVSPWFDHPPLFALIIGFASIVGGAPTMFDCALEYMRLPPIIFGTLSTVLVYLLGSQFYKKSIGIIAAMFYATVPVIVITNRLAVAENMLTFLLLLAIYSTLRYTETIETKYLWIVLICAPIAILTKLIGLSVTIIVVIILISHNYRKESVYIFLSGIFGIIIYLMYGFSLDWNLFVAVNTAQGERFTIHYKLFFDILTRGSSITYSWIDGWVIFGWISLAYSTIKDKKQILSIGAGIYLITVIFSSGFFAYYWYVFPLFPFLCIACGKYINDLMEHPNLVLFFIFFISAWLLILVGIYSETYHPIVGNRAMSILIIRGIFSGVFGVYILHFIFRGRRTKVISSATLVCLFLTYIALNTFIVIFAQDTLPLLAELSRYTYQGYERR